MKGLHKFFAGIACLSALAFAQPAFGESENLKMAVADFESCIEKSQQGMNEKKTLEAMGKQISDIMSSKETELVDLSKKLQNPDYIDGLSPKAEEEEIMQMRRLQQEFAQAQQQYQGMVGQAQMQFMEKMMKAVSEASAEVAKNKGFDAVVPQKILFYFNPDMDVTDQVIQAMNKNYSASNPDAGNS